MQTRWLSLRENISTLDEIKISRHVLCANPINIQLHSSCDASEIAYGACIYIRSCYKFNNCMERFLMSKARVAPMKKLSIPKLELCGSRGLDLKFLGDSQLYWKGLVWLEQPISQCPLRNITELPKDDCIPEAKITSLLNIYEQNSEFLSTHSKRRIHARN